MSEVVSVLGLLFGVVGVAAAIAATRRYRSANPYKASSDQDTPHGEGDRFIWGSAVRSDALILALVPLFPVIPSRLARRQSTTMRSLTTPLFPVNPSKLARLA